MRVLALLPLAACLSSPTGLEQSWPPPGAEVIAATTIDRAGNTDLAIAVAGEHPGIYLIRSDEIQIGPAPQISTFTAFHPRSVERPITLYDNHGQLVITSRAENGVSFEVLDATSLEVVADEALAMTVPEETLWMSEVVFPGGVPRLAVGSEGEIKHLSADLGVAMANNIPAPVGGLGTWNETRFAYGFADGSNGGTQSAVVVTNNEIFKSVIPAGMGAPGFGIEDWVSLRGAPRRWRGPATGDLDANGVLEVFGLDGGEMCGLDPTVATMPMCFQAPAPLEGDATTFVARINLGPDVDIMLVTTEETRARVAVLVDCALTDNALTCSSSNEGGDIAIEAAIPILFRADDVNDVLLIGRDGVTACDPGAGKGC